MLWWGSIIIRLSSITLIIHCFDYPTWEIQLIGFYMKLSTRLKWVKANVLVVSWGAFHKTTQLDFTCSELTIEALEQGVEYVQSCLYGKNSNIHHSFLVYINRQEQCSNSFHFASKCLAIRILIVSRQEQPYFFFVILKKSFFFYSVLVHAPSLNILITRFILGSSIPSFCSLYCQLWSHQTN